MHKVILILVLIIITGCSTTQQRVTKLRKNNKNTSFVKLPCNVEQSKQIVREITKEIKFIERKYGSGDVKDVNENFLLITNNRLKDRILSLILGGFIWSPRNIGVFFDFNEELSMTIVTISEEVSIFGLERRNELYWRLNVIAIEMGKSIENNATLNGLN